MKPQQSSPVIVIVPLSSAPRSIDLFLYHPAYSSSEMPPSPIEIAASSGGLKEQSEHMDDKSASSMESMCDFVEIKECKCPDVKHIQTFHSLQKEMEEVYKETRNCDFMEERRAKLVQCLSRLRLHCSEVKKYAKSSLENIPYTRNLIFQNEDFSLLCLVWKPGVVSKIHSHPCQGCMIVPLQGAITETIYKYDTEAEDGTLEFDCTNTFAANDTESGVSFMADSLNKVHSIGSDSGCISLHLYTPPFSKCKVWLPKQDNDYKLNDAKEVLMCFYSQYGVVPPPVEGGPICDLEFYI